MRLAEKIIWICLSTIAIVFSVGGTYLITQNHTRLLNESIQQNIDQHLTLSYSLETKLVQDGAQPRTQYGYNRDKMNSMAIYYLQQISNTKTKKGEAYALYQSTDTLLSSTIKKKDLSKYIKSTNAYTIEHENSTYTMYISSYISPNFSDDYILCNSYDLSSIYQERTMQFQSFIIMDIGMLTIAFFIIRFFSNRLTQPINKLNEISQHIAKGHYEQRTNIHRKDEIGELSQSFDEMANATYSTIQELKANAEAKETFMGSFSHEIKTPMTAIIGFADMLRSYECDLETIQKSAHFIYQEGTRLEQLSTSLMELLSLSNLHIALEKTSLTPLIEQLKEYYKALQVSNVVFHVEDAIVLSNPTLLYTLLKNLIDNALKASQGTIVRIEGCLTSSTYEFKIIDEGIGMDEEQLLKACEPFYMADPSRKRTKGGAGLGLSICKRICELHNCELHIQSSPSQGTSITFQLEVDFNEA